VRGIEKGPEKAHRKGFDPRFQKLLDRVFNFLIAQRANDCAETIDTLIDPSDKPARNEKIRLFPQAGICSLCSDSPVGFLRDATNDDRVLMIFSGDYSSLGVGSIDKTIDRAGGADLKDFGLFEQIG